MNDTSDKIAAMVKARHEAMTVAERLHITAQMFETARKFVEASLPPNLSRYERRLAYIKRMYGDELPEAAQHAYAAYAAAKDQSV
ncbi:MAG: hypothetical protein HC872_09185 [Gammaproteobacteria bacterium]|nr:hypothetical protein [Gammaproteobacteria bacterium]